MPSISKSVRRRRKVYIASRGPEGDCPYCKPPRPLLPRRNAKTCGEPECRAEQNREANKKRLRARRQDPAVRKKVNAAQKKYMREKLKSPAFRKKRNAAKRARYKADPEFRERLKAAGREHQKARRERLKSKASARPRRRKSRRPIKAKK